jgi:hypothetical protein
MENREENSEKIGKIRKKGRVNSENDMENYFSYRKVSGRVYVFCGY